MFYFTSQIRAWILKGASKNAPKDELQKLYDDPSLLDPAVDNALKQDDKDRSGTLEWEEVKDKWEEQLMTQQTEADPATSPKKAEPATSTKEDDPAASESAKEEL